MAESLYTEYFTAIHQVAGAYPNGVTPWENLDELSKIIWTKAIVNFARTFPSVNHHRS